MHGAYNAVVFSVKESRKGGEKDMGESTVKPREVTARRRETREFSSVDDII